MPGKTNPIYTTKNRASGTMIELHDMSLEGGYESKDPKWHIRCAEHDEIAVFKKQGDAYKAMTQPVWCDGCARIMDGKADVKEAAAEGFEAYVDATKITPEEVEEVPPPPVWQPPPKPEAGNLTNHQKVMSNICPLCGGELKAADGHWHETGRPPVACCCACKGHVVARTQQD